jgi:hypothetical protein
MGHEIDQSRNRQGAAFSVLQSMWHRLGVILSEAPKTVEEALRLSCTDFEVELIELYARSEALPELQAAGADYVYDDVELGRGVRRMDTGVVIGVVGPSYHVLQNADAFGVLTPMLEQGLCSIETGGALRNGQDVWMLVKFDMEALQKRYARSWIEEGGTGATNPPGREMPDPDFLDEMAASEEITTYGLITNNHAGKRAVIVRETPVRVVCANTLEFALGADDGMTVKCCHTENVKQNVESAAALLFAGMAERYASVAEKRSILMGRLISEEQFRANVLDIAVPVRHLERKIQRRESSGHTTAALDRANAKRISIRNLWEEGEGHSGDHTAWDALNGLAQALDHDEKFENSRGEDRMLQSLYDGTARQIKGKVCNRLLSLAAS